MSRTRSATLALCSGLLLALSFPGPGLWPLALIAYAPLLLALEGASAWRGAWLGWLTHAALNLIVCRFLWVPLRELGSMSPGLAGLALVLLAALQGLRGAALGWLTAQGNRVLPLPSAFLLAHLASDAVPLLFHWDLSALLRALPPLVQTASLGGAPLVALWGAAASAVSATLAARVLGRRWPWRWAWGPALGLGLAWGWGQQRYAQQLRREEREETWSIGLLHGAIPLRPDQPPDVEGWLETVQAYRQAEALEPRLILLPETILPFPVRRTHLAHDARAQWLNPPRIPLVVGGIVEAPEGSINSALLHPPEGPLQATGKQVLLPFGEYIPFERWLPWLRLFSPRTARLGVPHETSTLRWEGRSLGVSICYEGVLPERVREAARQGQAQLLLNLTNDAWFPGTHEPEVHLAHTQLRAVELGRYLARATNQGITVVVAPSGRILAQATGAPTRPLMARVGWRSDLTWFARWGRLAAWGAAAGLLVLLGRRSPVAPTPGAQGAFSRRKREKSENFRRRHVFC